LIVVESLKQNFMLDKQHWNVPPKTNKRKESDANGREGGDDSLVDSSPTDNRSDEKVVVNEQRANKIVNGPSQTAANTSEGSSYDEEIVD
jgi:hypothetical protein